MEFSKDIVVGLKFYIGPIDLEGISTSEFVDAIGFTFSADIEDLPDSTGLFSGDNTMQCKYFDDEEGYMYVNFEKEVSLDELPFFEEDEMIFKKIEE